MKGYDCLPPISDPILLMSASELSQRIKDRSLSCEHVVRVFIRRCLQVDKLIHAIVDERFGAALDEAAAIDQHLADGDSSLLTKPLLGVPFSGKDSIAVKDLKWTGGLTCRSEVRAVRDSDVIANLKYCGAICICTTNVPELCFWFDCDNKLFGRSNNPYDFRRIPGGSTGANAALISAAGSVIGNAADILGSIRMPASFNGIFGHKPSPGVTPLPGNYPEFSEYRSQFLVHGPLCRYAEDLLPMLSAMAGGHRVLRDRLHDLKEPVDWKEITVYYQQESESRLASNATSEVKDAVCRAANHFRSLGSHVREVRIRGLADAVNLMVECFKDPSSPPVTELATDCCSEISVCSELFKWLIGQSDHTLPLLLLCLGEKLIGREIGGEKNMRYKRKLQDLKHEFEQLLGSDGLFIFPSFPTPSPKHGTTLLQTFDVPAYVSVFNLMGVPVTQVPMGLSQRSRRSRLPLGVQVVGGPMRDRLTIAAAQQLQQRFGGWVSPSKVAVSGPEDSFTSADRDAMAWIDDTSADRQL